MRAAEELLALARRAKQLREDLRFLLRAADADYVYFLEVRGRGVFLRAAPIDVSQMVRESVLDRRASTVLTSATLSVAGSFEYVRGRLGVTAGTRAAPAFRVRLRAASDPVPAAPHAASEAAGLW